MLTQHPPKKLKFPNLVISNVEIDSDDKDAWLQWAMCWAVGICPKGRLVPWSRLVITIYNRAMQYNTEAMMKASLWILF